MVSVKSIGCPLPRLVPQAASELRSVDELAESVVPQHLKEHVSLGWIKEVKQTPLGLLRRRGRTPADFATKRRKGRPAGPPIPGIRCPDN